MDESEIASYLEQYVAKKYIVQPYIQSRTEEGLPFDIRIHVRRGKDGQWMPVKVYPRIGRGDGITSNLSQGGSIAQLKPFLKRQFMQNSIKIEKELNKLAVEFPTYFQRAYDKPLAALGLDIGIDEKGKLWLFEVNPYPGSTMFELESQQVAMGYAKYIAISTKKEQPVQNEVYRDLHIVQKAGNKKVIGMFSPVKTVSKLKSGCVAAAALYECEFFYFTSKDINYEDMEVTGRTYRDGEWGKKVYCYKTGIDAIYDRVRLVGMRKCEKVYKALAHIPTTHTRTGTSLNKLLVYDKFIKEGSLKKYLIPYEHYKNADVALQFLEKHKELIIKPDVGLGGANLYYISKQADTIKVVRKASELKFTAEEFKEWIEKTVGTTPYVVQKYIDTRTVEEQPFDIRVHMMRNYKNTWDFVAVYPRVGVDFEKITPMFEGGYMARWQAFVERNFGQEKYKEINKQMRSISRKMIKVFEKEFQQNISELGIDLAISKEGEIYLLELNLHRPGISYYEFDVAKRAIGYAKHLAEQNS